MLNIQIDGITCICEKGEFLLDIARRNGILIPTLCHHPGVDQQGCCRVCLAEVAERGKRKIVVSCVYPVERECEVFTQSDRVRENRAVVLMLLRLRAPASPELERMCEEYGVADGSRFRPLDGEKCIMCGLCARACASLGTGAISTVGRGIEKKVSTPYDEPSKACIGCLSCVNVCPTDAILFKEDDKARSIWGRSFELMHCESCGSIIGTKEEVEFAAEKSNEDPKMLCADCKKAMMAGVLAHTYGIK